MTVALCLELPTPPPLPRLEIPQFGILEAARQSLHDLPDISVYLMSLQELAANALAPLRRFLELIELIAVIPACFSAVIDALFPPSPGPIIDCLKDFAKALARLIAFFPPISYIQTILDLCDYVILVVSEIISVFVLLDDRLTAYRKTLSEALELGDLELAAITDCASQEVGVLTLNLMDLLKFITPLIKVIVVPIARLIPEPNLRELLKSLANIPQLLTDAQALLEETEGPPVIQPLTDAMSALQAIAVGFYNVLAPIIGKAPDRRVSTVPDFVNF
jgi:hypothetical protein